MENRLPEDGPSADGAGFGNVAGDKPHFGIADGDRPEGDRAAPSGVYRAAALVVAEGAIRRQAADVADRLGVRPSAAIIGGLSALAWLAVAGIVAVVAACAAAPADRTLSLLNEVNVAVNRSVAYVAEPPGRNDWRVADTEGDCEDIALRKRRDLIGRGFPGLDLSVLVVPGHAMLLARTPRGAFTLDNRTDKLVAWDGSGREYLPLGAMWLPRDYVLRIARGAAAAPPIEVAGGR
jgi:predicted transglutaminase-like cysteine proteinase